ncbi:MAG: ion channel [Myxococcota bacterium]
MPSLNQFSLGSNLGRFGSLLVSLVLVFAAGPFFSDEASGVSEISILYTVVMIVGAYAVSQRPRVFFVGVALAIPAIATEWISNFIVTTPLILSNMIFGALFIIYVSGVVLYEVMNENEVTLDTIAGGVAIYLLIGIGWVLAYAGIEYVSPGAFTMNGSTLQELHPETQVRYTEFLYFSFVTMTTLGFGDMVPMIPEARGATAAEAVVGQLYVAVFVARLVGLHLASRTS